MSFCHFLSCSPLIPFVGQMSLSLPIVPVALALVSYDDEAELRAWGVQDTLTQPPRLIPPQTRSSISFLLWFWFLSSSFFSELN